MKKSFLIFAAILMILLLGTIAFHRFQHETKKIFFSIFPVFAWQFVDQPILFNHLVHKEKLSLNCNFCHRYVENYRVAGIPNIELCRICHSSEAFSKRPEALKVFEYVKVNKQIPWVRMYELPPHVVFPHWVHVKNGVDCSTCHGFTGISERPAKMVDRNYMEGCQHCHEEKGASVDCYACHSS